MISPVTHVLPTPSTFQAPAPSSESVSRAKRNVGDYERYWPQNATLKIALYDADPAFVEKVKEAASKWLPHINLKFDFVAGDEGDIRIAQTRTRKQGSSAVGTDALNVPADGPTMLLPHDPQDPRFAYVVTHEFGHVIGVLHAHQHPDTEIPWNTPVAYSAYNRALGKSKAEVDAQILPLPRQDTYQYEPYDRHSIMHYDINKLTTFGGWEQRESPELSAGDIALASKAYPKTTSATPSLPRAYPTPPRLPEEYHRLWRD